MIKKYSFLFICLLISACNLTDLKLRSSGHAGEELIYLVPGDKIKLDSGDTGYVDADGYLVGIQDLRIPAVGHRVREIVKLLSYEYSIEFKRYKVINFGKRSIDVRGAVRTPGNYDYPPGSDWSIMNLLIKSNGFTGLGKREYLLIRKAWGRPGKFVFIRGRSLPLEESIGGDNLLLYAHDRVIFPGNEYPIYVFGAVKSKAGGTCFSFYDLQQPPTLKDGVEQSGGFSKSANTKNIQVYRVLRSQKQSIIHLDYKSAQEFKLQPWDVVYIESEIPKELLEKGD